MASRPSQRRLFYVIGILVFCQVDDGKNVKDDGFKSKMKRNNIFVERDGVQYLIESVEELKTLQAYIDKYLLWLTNEPDINFGRPTAVQQSPVSVPAMIVPAIKPSNPTLPQGEEPNQGKRFFNSVKQDIQNILDSGTITIRSGTPPHGERGVDYFVRAFVHLNALKGSGVYVTFPQLCLNMLQEGMSMRSDTADKAIASVRSMIRGTEVEQLIEKKGEGMCLIRLPSSAGQPIQSSHNAYGDKASEVPNLLNMSETDPEKIEVEIYEDDDNES